jgi:hypothetical protein
MNITKSITRSNKTTILALSWIALIVMELLGKRGSHSNRAIEIFSIAFRLIKRLIIIGLLIANVFMTITAIDNDEKENSRDR